MGDDTIAARDVDEVISALDAIVEDARGRADRLGYFAAVYRTVTVKVREGIREGFFDDPDRMERLDVRFANRYLEALAVHRRGGRPSRSWAVAFDAATQRRPVILQHLLIGINAHINLDLGIAAAATAPGEQLPALRRDFDRINQILASLIERMSRDLGEVSPWVSWVARASGGRDDELVRFSLQVARRAAWRFATELAPLPQQRWDAPVRVRDQIVARLGETVLHPGAVLSTVLLLVRLRERGDVAAVIDALSGVRAPDLATVEQRVHEHDA